MDFPEQRAEMQIAGQGIELRFSAVGYHLDGAVVEVANRACDAEFAGTTLGELAEADALHVAADNVAASHTEVRIHSIGILILAQMFQPQLIAARAEHARRRRDAR